ncbi:MAG: patatin-like phospholipase family protein [Alphaproteobacteria bacterium]|nr:patatin-like phospholipase family protein [Alphaproteobacteria bacterium]MCB9985762.1 patatin-like phospholipase family protein [Micavibrio sp.]
MVKSKKSESGKTDCKKINMALQGGGAHGAFTWGVLDEFLKQDGLDFEGISATSAGSMNAVVMAHGLITGGNDAARQALEDFWHKVSEAGSVFSPVAPNAFSSSFVSPFSAMADMFSAWQGEWNEGRNNAAHFINLMSQNISPYQFNPFNINPLLDILKDMVDFKKIRTNKDVQLFITATNVQTGDARIFKTEELTADMVMASAALPNVFRAVKVDGDYFWDGGFVGNPSLWPLFYEVDSNDVLIVHVNPLVRNEIPKEAPEIENRLNEVTFNASLLKELRAISFVQKLLSHDMIKEEYKSKYRDVLIHAIRAEDAMSELDLSSKFDTSWPFLKQLRDQGQQAAKDWLKNNYDAIGKKSTIDITRDYLEPRTKSKETK